MGLRAWKDWKLEGGSMTQWLKKVSTLTDWDNTLFLMNEQLDCTVTGYTVYSISIRVSLCGLLHICYTCYYDSCLHLGGIKKIFIIFFSSKYSWFPKTFLFSQILNYLNVFSCSNLIKMKKGLLQVKLREYIFNLDKVWSSDSELLETLRQYWKDIREP